MLSIRLYGEFLVERFSTCSTTTAGFDNSVHADGVERLVHCVAEATAWAIVMRAASTGRSVHASAGRFRRWVQAHWKLKVLASHATVIVSVWEQTSEKLRVTLQSFCPPSGGKHDQSQDTLPALH